MDLRSIGSTLSIALVFMTLGAVPACGSALDGHEAGSDGEDPGAVPPRGAGDASAPAPTVDTPTTPSAPPAPPPLNGEVGKWTWFDVPESMCANGKPTGLGVNLGTGSDLLVVLEGGGGCWDQTTCDTLNLATNIKGGYDQAVFQAELGGDVFKNLVQGGIFDRSAPNNPFKDSSIVWVPYCTGDLHVGDATQQFVNPTRTMHYAGRKNIDAFLAKIVPAFPNVSRVTWSGFSAGGIGAAINYWRAQTAFGKIRVDLIDDSGPPFEQSQMPLYPAWNNAWNVVDGGFPPECSECKTNVAALIPYYAKTYPASRFAILSYDQDIVISTFFLSPGPIFANHLRQLATSRIAPTSNFRYFVVGGTSHGLVGDLATKSDDVQLGDWLTQMVTDAPAWTNHGEN